MYSGENAIIILLGILVKLNRLRNKNRLLQNVFLMLTQ